MVFGVTFLRFFFQFMAFQQGGLRHLQSNTKKCERSIYDRNFKEKYLLRTWKWYKNYKICEIALKPHIFTKVL